jgi:hypothetical protein
LLRKLRLRCVGIEPLTGFPHQTKRLEERYLQFRHAGHAVTKHLGTKHLGTKHLGTKHLGTKHLGTKHFIRTISLIAWAFSNSTLLGRVAGEGRTRGEGLFGDRVVGC